MQFIKRMFFLLLVYTKYALYVWYCRKPFIPNYDLEIRPWWVFCKIWPLPKSCSLWRVDAKSVLKMIFASISSRITRDRSLKTRPTYFSPSLATTPVLCNSLMRSLQICVLLFMCNFSSFKSLHFWFFIQS